MLESKALSEPAGRTPGASALVQPERSVLAEFDLFADFDPVRLAAIEQACRYRRFSAQEQIIDKDSQSSDVYFIVRGRARVVSYSVSGREITFADLGEGAYFGELSAIDGEPRSAGVMAVDESMILSLPRRVFLSILGDNPPVALKVLRRLAHMVRTGDERIMDLSTLAANNRVHAELLRQARDHASIRDAAVIEPIPVHSDIASRVSTTRETVARVLNDLARKGILERTRTALVIRNVPVLREMVEEVRG